VRFFSRQAVLNVTGMMVAALTLILVLPIFFLIEVLGVGHDGLQILASKIRLRRSSMKHRRKFSVTAIALLAWLVLAAGLAAAQRKPNILLIVSDDTGYGDSVPPAAATGAAYPHPTSTEGPPRE
jgi:hypothetical protein